MSGEGRASVTWMVQTVIGGLIGGLIGIVLMIVLYRVVLGYWPWEMPK